MELISRPTPHVFTSGSSTAHSSSWRRRLKVWASAVPLTLTTLALPSTPAQATETVADGGFEAATDTHINPWWVRDGDNAFFNESAARTGSWSGGLHNLLPGNPSPALQQTITIPARHSAALRYWRSFYYKTADAAPLVVYIDGVVVDTVNNNLQGTWVEESVDLSDFADGSQHLLRFERTTSEPPVRHGGSVQGVLLDDVSVMAAPLPDLAEAVVQLTYTPQRMLFEGKIDADQGCAADRTVILKRVKRGVDPIVATTAPTGSEGLFKISKDARPGRYYALIKRVEHPNVTCLADKSPRVRVN